MRAGTPQLIVVAALLLAAAPAAAYLPPAYGGKLTAPLADRPVTLAPWKATRASELQLVRLLYDTLFVRRGQRAVPHLVARAETSADGKTWTLHLRPRVLLHDRKTLRPSHVVRALQRARRGPHRVLLADVTHVNYTATAVLLRLRRPQQLLPLLLSTPATAIAVSRGRRLIGSGPFRLVTRRRGDLLLKAHAAHFAGRPYLDQLRLKVYRRASAEAAAFQVGSAQLSFHGASVFGGRPRYRPRRLTTLPGTTLQLAFGNGRPFLADRQLRDAFSLAIDRRRLARLAGGAAAEPAGGPLCRKLLRQRRHRPLPFDRSRARRLLKAAATRFAALRRSRVKLTLLVDASRYDDRVVAGQLIADLDRIGFSVTVAARPAADYERRLAAGGFQLALARSSVQADHRRIALAGALAAAGARRAAARCLRRRCRAATIRRLVRRSRLLPLVHVATRVDYDARLGGVSVGAGAQIAFDEIYWSR